MPDGVPVCVAVRVTPLIMRLRHAQAVDSTAVAVTHGTFIYKGTHGQWSTLVVKNVRVIQSCNRFTSQNPFNSPVRGHNHDVPNIALWSSLPLLPHSPF